MSLATDRAEIAEALTDEAAGLTGYALRPRSLKTGDSWPLLEQLVRGPANDFLVTWSVVVVLPAGEFDAMSKFDALYAPVTELLEDVGYVERIEPGTLSTDSGLLNIMLITLNKEA